MNHNWLAQGLAAHLMASKRSSSPYNKNGQARMIWLDPQMGSSMSGVVGGPDGSRPDVYTVDRSYRNPNCTTYEVKVSRADFLQDVKKNKWTKYVPFQPQDLLRLPEGDGGV